jgi:hypothetical protein
LDLELDIRIIKEPVKEPTLNPGFWVGSLRKLRWFFFKTPNKPRGNFILKFYKPEVGTKSKNHPYIYGYI